MASITFYRKRIATREDSLTSLGVCADGIIPDNSYAVYYFQGSGFPVPVPLDMGHFSHSVPF